MKDIDQWMNLTDESQSLCYGSLGWITFDRDKLILKGTEGTVYMEEEGFLFDSSHTLI